MPGLGASFGRGGATTSLQDLANADCIVIQGSNMAECHPVGFQWVMEAKARGAKVVHIDPRFTRTSAQADTYVPIRSGSDIVLLGAVIKQVLERDLWFEDYVRAYTNAAWIVSEDFEDTEDLDGLFSGFDQEKRAYDTTSWQYAGQEEASGDESHEGDRASSSEKGQRTGAAGASIETHEVEKDETLQHPHCVFQILKRHFARYTPEMVEEMCGISRDLFDEIVDAFTQNSGRERTTALVYSVGWTQRGTGVQYIRTGAILQLLLGNMGRPGGGIMALRGHASIQGSTDIPTLYNLLPGYLEMPHVDEHDTLQDYIEKIKGSNQKGFWGKADTYVVSLLKAYFGDNATADNDYCFDYLPRINGDHGTYSQVMDMIEGGKIFGYFLLGQNPAVGSANGRAQRLGLANLDWLVVRDLVMIESATFWQNAPEIETGEIVAEECRTEVFFMPAATHVEKKGTFTQTQRLLQWREQATEPPGDCTSDLWFIYHLGRKMREKLAASTDERDRPLLEVAWDYPLEGEKGDPDGEAVLKEINGYDLTTGKTLSAFTELKADGSTSAGCWIYTGVYADGVNQAARRKPAKEQNWLGLEWGWAWPANRRVLYNRASADPDGKPWSERKALVWWDEDAQEWTGHDVPDFQKTKSPHFRPEPGASGPDALAGDDAFIMQADGKAWLYAPKGAVDGPLPTHYEPGESPVRNGLYTQQQNPTREVYTAPFNEMHPSPPEPGSSLFPYVWTTSRLTEHHTAGGMSRYLPYLAELQPELFMEVSPELAAERGLRHLEFAHVITARAVVEARVLVTDRLTPLRVQGQVIHQVWLPYHWGPGGLTTGDVVNDLPHLTLDPNVHIQECKAGTCDVRPGRRPRGPAVLDLMASYRSEAGVTEETGTVAMTTTLIAHRGDAHEAQAAVDAAAAHGQEG
ncbi:formate dehydrogenase major subunit [Motilibacter rhizosphaerae]|uniref:Formate dehydrogenase major subunit n=1 Tax=Motilibacter rhizosphaerae TaxID=598652 RepID=A0A4Q7NVH6_9ACTN|nr:formate dehydrogenase major subunit [Motilibacter rhizosphaerae]